MKYYSLLTSHADDGIWFVQFGSYDRSEVAEERLDWHGVPKVSTMILVTASDRQADIDAGVAKLNGYQRTPDDSKEPEVPYDC